jgi:predicted transcriptional regulator
MNLEVKVALINGYSVNKVARMFQLDKSDVLKERVSLIEQGLVQKGKAQIQAHETRKAMSKLSSSETEMLTFNLKKDTVIKVSVALAKHIKQLPNGEWLIL